MDAKDWATFYVGTDADGTAKSVIAIIGKAKNPSCFWFGTLTVPYFITHNMWPDSASFWK